MKALRFPAGLYGVTPEWMTPNACCRPLRRRRRRHARAAAARKNVPDAERAAQARANPVPQLGVVFLINDDWKLALEVGADAPTWAATTAWRASAPRPAPI